MVSEEQFDIFAGLVLQGYVVISNDMCVVAG